MVCKYHHSFYITTENKQIKKIIYVAQFKPGEYFIGRILLQLPDELLRQKNPKPNHQNQTPQLKSENKCPNVGNWQYMPNRTTGQSRISLFKNNFSDIRRLNDNH